MNHTRYVDALSGNSKQSAVVAIQKVPVLSSQAPVLDNQWASLRKVLQGMELLFHLEDKLIRICRTVFSNVAPDGLNVRFSSSGDPNFESCGHA